ncbi:adhesin [Methanobrevibacter sp.]|uniref:adhesin n=1 Tax=Methanobrevibacter sp. TaxID=66852 RepID=UPI00388E70EB
MRKNLYFASLIVLVLIFSVSFVSASEVDANNTQSAGNPIDYYVDLGGDDNNLGYMNSPFYSINKAISVTTHSDVAAIHLGEGIFEGQDNTMITINKAHQSRGGSITIQGAGADKTFIDGSSAYYIFNIRSDAIITLKDLSIVNCKSVTGGAITNTGTLSIVNCGFENNRAINYGGSIYSADSATLTVKDSTFINNTAKVGGAIYSTKSDLKIDSSTFIGNYIVVDDSSTPWGGALYIGSYFKSVPSVINSKFINNSAISYYYRSWEYASGGSIYMQRCNLNNVSFINSKTQGINAQGGSYYSDPKYANSLINILRINSTVNGVLEQNIYPSNYNGEYLSDVLSYVSPQGSDIDGDGSINNPFATIAHVIEMNNGKAYNLVINLLNGTYKGSGNTNLDIPSSMNIKIIGSNSIFDGKNNNYLFKMEASSNGLNFELVNLTITNFKSQSNGYEKEDNIGIIHTYANTIIDNCNFTENHGSIITNFDSSNVIINNSVFTDNSDGILYSYDAYMGIFNSIINNTKYLDERGIIRAYQRSLDDAKLVIENTSIINSKGVYSPLFGMRGRAIDLHGVDCEIIDSLIADNNLGSDIVAFYNPSVVIVNSTFANGSGFTNEMKFNVKNSSFIGNKNLLFTCSNSFENTFDSVLFKNNNNVEFNGNQFAIVNSAIYDIVGFYGFTAANSKINLDNNYWAGLNPSQLIKRGSDVSPSLWIVRSVSAENLFNGSFDVKLDYKLNNNEEYDVSGVPIKDVAFVLEYESDAVNGILTKEGHDVICDVGEDDLNASIYFEDNITLDIYAQNLHPSQCIIGLSTNVSDIGQNIDIDLDIVDMKTNRKISEGFVNLFLNGDIIGIFTLNGDKLTKTITVNGTKSLNNISVKYFGNANFTDSQAYKLFLIKSIPLDTVLAGDNLVKYYKNASRYELTLRDALGNPLGGKDIEIIINDVSYVRQTKDNGVASIAINLNPGQYNIIAKFNGDDSFNRSVISNNVTVLSTLIGSNLTKYHLNASQYYIQVLDGLGNPIKGKNITMNINGVFYTRMTNDNGFAKLNINLHPGTYILTAYHPVTGLQYSNIITVLSRIETGDLGMFYKDGTRFDAKLYDGAGNVLVNANVTFNINGVFYTRASDSNGFAHLNINLLPGKYIITAFMGDSIVCNVITIDPMPVMIVSYGVNVNRGEYYQVRFFDAKGNPIVSQDAAIVVNGNMNIVKTDGEGIASLKMDYPQGTYYVESGLTATYFESKSIYSYVNVVG